MENRYNLSQLRALFQNYLLAENAGKATIKNYSSDLNYFFGWLQKDKNDFDEKILFDLLTQSLLENYKLFLIDEHFPLTTVKRRLSSLRKFCSFCISQGWMKENPAKHITFTPTNYALRTTSYELPTTPSQLDQFENYLKTTSMNTMEIEKNLTHLREFTLSIQSSV